MMKDNRLFDDLVRVAGGAASLLSSVGQQLGADFRGLRDNDARDEGGSEDIQRLQATISKFRLEQESLKKRVAELEAALAGTTKPAKATKESAAKKSGKSATAAKPAAAKKITKKVVSATKKPAKRA